MPAATTKTKSDLRLAHGTPAQFKRAVLRAVADGTVTLAEAQAAIGNYEAEYAAASDCPRHRYRVVEFNEDTGVALVRCKCGAERNRTARFLCAPGE